MTSPGAGASTGTTNAGTNATGTNATGTTNTVPAMGSPVGSTAAGGVVIGTPGSSSSNTGPSTSASVADAGVDAADGGDGVVDAADAGAAAADAGDGGVLAQALDDGQVINIVDVLNASELEQAQAVLPRLQIDAVRAFAQLMIEEHQRARDTFTALAAREQIAPANSAVADELRAQSQAVLAALASVDAAQVDAAYLEAQVTAHTEAETLLAQLVADSDSEALAAELTQLRLNVQGHLQSAVALQSSLQNGTAL